MLGITVGVASIIAMVAIGDGARVQIENQINTLGPKMIMISPFAQQTGGVSMGSGTQVTLTPDDALAIERDIPGVKAVSPVVQARGQIAYGDKNWTPRSIRGEGHEYLEVKDWAILEGDFFTAEDVDVARKVCVIGTTISETLFPDESPVGKILRIQNMPFRILGVLDRKGTSAGGDDQDDVIIAPWTTVKRVLKGSTFRNVDLVLVSAETLDGVDDVSREVGKLLRERHGIPDDRDEDFRILPMTDVVQAATATTRVMTLLLASVASISLVVGGVGIMNIMLVSVAERTREIGLRMAVGARGRDILSQFLTEALVLSLGAGMIGVALGTGGIALVAHGFNWPTHISLSSILLGVGSSTIVGIFFGLYPSLKASRLQPIVALRHE
jgi:putative ABC transport system permease protein